MTEHRHSEQTICHSEQSEESITHNPFSVNGYFALQAQYDISAVILLDLSQQYQLEMT